MNFITELDRREYTYYKIMIKIQSGSGCTVCSGLKVGYKVGKKGEVAVWSSEKTTTNL